jgi:hypothetical protein
MKKNNINAFGFLFAKNYERDIFCQRTTGEKPDLTNWG